MRRSESLVIAALLVLAAACGSGGDDTATSPTHRVTVELSEFVDGIGFGLHPTSDPVVVRTSAPEGSLKLCPAGSDLVAITDPALCEELVPGEPTELPSTSGAEHIGVRVSTESGDPTIGAVVVEWTSADSFFAVQPDVVEPSESRVIGMTSTSSGEVVASFRPEGEWEIEFTGPGAPR